MAKDFLKKVKSKSEKNIKLVFTEPHDLRILKAVKKILNENLATPILVGDEKKILQNLKKFKISLSEIKIVNPKTFHRKEEFVSTFFNLRKQKGISLSESRKILLQPNYFGTMLLYKDEADCLISGASYNTVETIKPALEIIKTSKEHKIVSSYFLMILDNKKYLFADCSIVKNPDSEQLAEIAISTADSAKNLGINPKVAFLSYSTKGSASGDSVDKIRNALKIFKIKRKNFIADGELQLDSAIIPEVAKIKCPNSPIKGQANVLIFPNLDSGNIGYKLVERLAKAKAIGPITQGLNKPVNILSRGCSVQDIVDLATITVKDSLKNK